MERIMTNELYWLAMTAGVTALFWMPYATDWIIQRGPMGAMGNPAASDPQRHGWADRAKRAHYNSVENLVAFAPLVLVASIAGISNATTLLACKLYFWARLAYYPVYSAGIPVVRTMLFMTGFVAQMMMFYALLTV